MSAPVLSLIVPVFNEARHLAQWCEMIVPFDFGVSVEFIVIDDCSTDGSLEILEEVAAKNEHFRVYRQEKNQGKGAAVARGIGESKGTFVMVQDADFEYSPKDVPAVIAPLLANDADVVFGSRYKNSNTVHRTAHYAINRFLTMFSNVFSGLYLTDMETCYKAFRGDIIRSIVIESPRFGIEPEITAKIASLNVRVAEVPIRYSPRNYMEGKKIRWTDGVAALWFIVKYNLDREKLNEATKKVPDVYKVQGRQWL